MTCTVAPPVTAFHGRLALDTSAGAFLGDQRVRLLEAIDRHGSISQAAKAVPMSYKAAWDAVDALNNMADAPLVERSVGGHHGGGSRLTRHGHHLVAVFRALEVEHQAMLDRVARITVTSGTVDPRTMQTLLRRMSMKTSARNQFVGKISGLREGAVSVEVRLRLDVDHEIVASVTRDSAETMHLELGTEVLALVKSSSVILMADPAPRSSARNQLRGEVSCIHEGPVNAEISVALPGGKTVTAVITHDSVGHLGLELGKPIVALFKASSVILASLD